MAITAAQVKELREMTGAGSRINDTHMHAGGCCGNGFVGNDATGYAFS